MEKKGFLFAVSACFVWGFIFVIPYFLKDFSPLEIALGRYFTYGVLSLFLLFRNGLTFLRTIPLNVWKKALIFGMFSNILYYVGVIVGLRYATSPITVLILAMAPVVVAIYGNFLAKEISFRSVAIPGFVICIGILLVNFSELKEGFVHDSLGLYILGVIAVIVAMFSWSWFAVHNARFLKNNPPIPHGQWSTLIGVATLGWVILAAIACIAFGGSELIDVRRCFGSTSLSFWAGITFLGVFCSWLGCYLWNQASARLPLTIAGPLVIFETIFSLLFVYILENRLPSFLEFSGIFFILGGVVFSVLLFRRSNTTISTGE